MLQTSTGALNAACEEGPQRGRTNSQARGRPPPLLDTLVVFDVCSQLLDAAALLALFRRAVWAALWKDRTNQPSLQVGGAKLGARAKQQQ